MRISAPRLFKLFLRIPKKIALQAQLNVLQQKFFKKTVQFVPVYAFRIGFQADSAYLRNGLLNRQPSQTAFVHSHYISPEKTPFTTCHKREKNGTMIRGIARRQ